MVIKVTEIPQYHHTTAPAPNIFGDTLRSALAKLRNTDFGNIGGMHMCLLSDGTYIQVVCKKASDGSELMNSQHVQRFRLIAGFPKLIRTYELG